MAFLNGKRALITGIASDRSIAWGIAKAMADNGAELALTYQNERLQPRVEKFAEQLGAGFTAPCDVSTDEQIEQLREAVQQHWDYVDIVVHSIAFAPREQLVGLYLDSVDRTGFQLAHDVSSYSFSALARTFSPNDERPQRRNLDTDLHWLVALNARLQRHGFGKSQPGS